MMTKKYVGITIGPIVKTLILTTTPAGLWGASYIFSYFTKKLVEKLKEKFPREESFLVPVQNDNIKNIVKDCPWAGLYHDRIIFEVDKEDDDEKILEKTKECIEKAKKELAEGLSADLIKEKPLEINKENIEQYIKEYIQAHGVLKEVKENENPIIELGIPLDVLELQQGYISKEKSNFILKFLENRDSLQIKKDENRNSKIKDSFLLNSVSDNKWHFLNKNSSIITIDDIVGVEQTKSKPNAQRKRYYALVKADGDNLGKVLKEMPKDKMSEKIKFFSEKCFEYAKDAFRVVEEYGGKMIYAGGDDLLFIAPVINLQNEKENIFSLLSKLEIKFKECFKSFSFKDGDKSKEMGFSAGVMLCYYKYPLCEALNGVLRQLDNSKAVKGKNTVSVYFEKHSGRQRNVQFKDFTKRNIFEKVMHLLSIYSKSESNEDFLRSVGRKIELYQVVFIEALKKRNGENFRYLERVVNNLFEEYGNVFLNNDGISSDNAEYIKKIIMVLEELFEANYEEKEKTAASESLKEIEAIIDLLSFYNEKEI